MDKNLKEKWEHRPGTADIFPAPPSHRFEIGERVDFGNIQDAEVMEVSPHGKILLLEATYKDRDHPNGGEENRDAGLVQPPAPQGKGNPAQNTGVWKG